MNSVRAIRVEQIAQTIFVSIPLENIFSSASCQFIHTKGILMSCIRTILFATALTSGASFGHAGIVVDADWWSNQTTVQNIVDPPGPNGPERLRLAGGFLTGFIEGTVLLPNNQTWRIDTTIGTDGQFNLPTEFVEVFIDGVSEGKFFNTPLSTIYDFQYTFLGDSFDYRFEFSSPSTDFGAHLIVGRGTVTNVPEPSSFVLLALFGAAFFVRGGFAGCHCRLVQQWKSPTRFVT